MSPLPKANQEIFNQPAKALSVICIQIIQRFVEFGSLLTRFPGDIIYTHESRGLPSISAEVSSFHQIVFL